MDPMIYPTRITRLAFFFVVPIIPKICWRQKIRNFWLLWYFDNHLAQNFIYTFHFHDSVMHKYTGLGSLSSQTQYLPLRNYFIKYPSLPLKIYATICNKIVNFWMAPLYNLWHSQFFHEEIICQIIDRSSNSYQGPFTL